MRGKLIVFEGIEGSGKTNGRDLPAVRRDFADSHRGPRQPGGTNIGQQIRQVLLQPLAGNDSLTSTSELLLYAADRAHHVERILLPALETGHLVICDRYTDSTVAYQGYGRQLNVDLIETLNTIATGGLVSDLTLWLKLDVAQGLERMAARGQADRIEQAGVEFHRRVHQGFVAQAQRHAERFITVDGRLSQLAVAEQVQAVVSSHLQQWYAL